MQEKNMRRLLMTRRAAILSGLSSGVFLTFPSLLQAADITAVEPQPYFAGIKRVLDALHKLGESPAPADEASLLRLAENPNAGTVKKAEEILGKYTLIRVRLNKDGIGSAVAGPAPRILVEQGWRSFLVRVENPFALETGTIFTGDAAFAKGSLSGDNTTASKPSLEDFAGYGDHWLGYAFASGPPLSDILSGLGVEYRILQLFSRYPGSRKAYLMVHTPDPHPVAGYTSQSRRYFWGGARSGFWTTFNSLPSQDIPLTIRDWDGVGCMASFLVRDEAGRLYPEPADRMAPDFKFQPQVYRADGETMRLPDGRYSVESWRGPEYIRKRQDFVVDQSTASPRLQVNLERWINAAELGWYPGDTHIHAAGCAHYEQPTQGVTPETIIRHVRGEALAVGDVLTWGPGYYHQKKFFSGHVYEPKNMLEYPDLQAVKNVSLKPKATAHDGDSVIRYDVEVSGFPSSHSGHLVLLRLTDQDYPGTTMLEEWPSWTLPVLKWAKAQGAVCGFAHCGIGMSVDAQSLPNYDIPPFSSVGANEYIVDVTHGVVDFMSGTETSPAIELNTWYHTLNCGFRVGMLGETDFPCLSDERVGMGRTYVGLDQPPAGDEGYDAWVDGIRRGRLYFGEGRSHFMNYSIDKRGVGGEGLKLSGPGKVKVKAKIAARLEETPVADDLPVWHIEHARIGASRTVTVEVVVNGKAVACKVIVADGKLRNFTLDIDIRQSSWVALRILPSGHTHPIFVEVADKPIRASRRSAEWCHDCVDALWKEKSPHIRPVEIAEAKAAYQHARDTYRRISSECLTD
jgi:hypothetical protein